MGLFSLRHRLRYLFLAKNRHGTHSPFVYTFIEQVLYQCTSKEDAALPAIAQAYSISSKQQALLLKMAAYYNCKLILMQENGQELLLQEADTDKRLYIVLGAIPNNWTMGAEDIIAMLKIHQSKKRFQAWQEAKNAQPIRYSIDLFVVGLLFFCEDFKMKQDFVLQY